MFLNCPAVALLERHLCRGLNRIETYLVPAYSPANYNEKIPIRVSQAPGEEITLSFLPAAAPLSYPLGKPFPQAAAPASAVLILVAVTPVAHPLAQAAPQIWQVAKKVDDEIAEILARPNRLAL